jgi:asparaginyl-tRNA synthetase
MEFLREVAHLRSRTNTFGIVMRVRNIAQTAIHKYFQVHIPFFIIIIYF